MTRSCLDDLAEKIQRQISLVVDVNPDDVELDRLLVEYGIDSVRAYDLIVALEDEFGVSIPDEDMRTLRTVEDIARVIRSRKAPCP